MSAGHRLQIPFGETGLGGLRLTADEYLALGETRERCELVGGVVIVAPTPMLAHQRVVREILVQLELHRRLARGSEVFSETDVQLGGSTVYRPDIVAYRPGRVAGYDVRLSSPPDLVVEVLSPATRVFDLTTKKDDYERSGVREYWAVDPADGRVRCYRREHEALVESVVRGDSLASTAVEGFTLDLAAVRAVGMSEPSPSSPPASPPPPR